MDITGLTNKYALSKTLRFRLIPVGETEKRLMVDSVLKADQQKADDYILVKRIIDGYHKDYIERRLQSFKFSEETLQSFANCYFEGKKEEVDHLKKDMMVKISKHLTGGEDDDEFKQLFGKELFTKLLPKFLKDEEEKQLVENFSAFTTYFTGYYQNRKNMYTGEGKTTEIAYRIIVQNLPKFLDNIRTWKRILSLIPIEIIQEVDLEMSGIIGLESSDIFMPQSFNNFISQSGIDKFNNYIGGYTCEDGTKVQGLNERINLYVQSSGKRLPKIRPLFKQILSDRDSISFIPENFENDRQLLQTVGKYCQLSLPKIKKIHEIFNGLKDYDTYHIFVANGAPVARVSSAVYHSWNVINQALERFYETEHPYPTNSKSVAKYEDDKKKYFKNIKSLSLGEMEDAVRKMNTENADIRLCSELSNKEDELYNSLISAYDESVFLLSGAYPEDKKLSKDNAGIKIIKTLLDSLKEYQHFAELFLGVGDEAEKDSIFYGLFEEAYESIVAINRLYDQVRNYLTKKPYSDKKIKLTFNRSDFLGGWAQPSEWKGQEAHLFEKEGKYYVFVTERTLKEHEWSVPLNSTADFVAAQHIEYYFQKPDNKNTPRLFIRSKGTSYAPAVAAYQLPLDDVIEVYDQGYFKTDYRKKNPELYKKSLTQIIDYFKLGFTRHDSYKMFDFSWKPSEQYNDIAEFYRDTMMSCYKIKKTPVNFNGLLDMVNSSMGYLFEIYSKDFSEFSHGMPNLHTLYFKALFDEKNVGYIRLQGGAEIFFRRASLKLSETTVHPKNQPLKNKNPLNPKQTSTFSYDLIKDARYVRNHYEIHMPIQLNCTSPGSAYLNSYVRKALKSASENYVIGIDRGERNLLYYCVVDSKGHLVEQDSLNVIENNANGVSIRTDYHALLDRKEKERLEARREWTAIEGIKDVKEGYLSQAIHRICQLIVKYHAIVVLENLNSGFKNARSAVEKSVYQKFEKMLCDKLSYMADKKIPPLIPGGILNAYQLAMPTTSYNDMQGQNGILFYVPAWMTSKIDPTTGFVNLLYPKYESIEKAKEFFACFDNIEYRPETNQFEFDTDYAKFRGTEADHRKHWVICTNGERIRTQRREDRNGQWFSDTVILTDQYIKLFDAYGIDYRSEDTDLQAAILRRTEKAFFVQLIKLFSLTLQMRNSITGTDVDYLISPVRNASGKFFDSREKADGLPFDADANGAYNIARKGLWIIEKLKKYDDEEIDKVKTSISNAQWLEYAQTNS